MLLTQILQNINITILPIIIIPVTGICCMVFYNRIAALVANLHNVQKELRNLYLTTAEYAPERKQQLISALKNECQVLERKTNYIRAAIIFCFSGIIAFVLSAISIMLSLVWQRLEFITFFLWLIGALCFAVGLIIGIIEIHNPILRSLKFESELLTQWAKEE